jgi:eukaryotic translation initiation factor 2C
MGVVTQCLKSQKVARANLQYWANVMLKYVLHTIEKRVQAQKLFTSRVNAKLGGVNNVLENSFLNDPVNPTIVMGMFVIGINSYILS